MILPSKHIKFSESLLGLSAFLIDLLSEEMTVDELWFKFSKINNNKNVFPSYHDFDNVILSLDFLYLIGVVNINSKGLIINASH